MQWVLIHSPGTRQTDTTPGNRAPLFNCIGLSLPECPIVGIIQYSAFSDGFLSCLTEFATSSNTVLNRRLRGKILAWVLI